MAKWRLLRLKCPNEVLASQVQGVRVTCGDAEACTAPWWRFEVSWVIVTARDLLWALLMKSTGLGQSWCSGTRCGSHQNRGGVTVEENNSKVPINVNVMAEWSAWPVVVRRTHLLQHRWGGGFQQDTVIVQVLFCLVKSCWITISPSPQTHKLGRFPFQRCLERGWDTLSSLLFQPAEQCLTRWSRKLVLAEVAVLFKITIYFWSFMALAFECYRCQCYPCPDLQGGSETFSVGTDSARSLVRWASLKNLKLV